MGVFDNKKYDDAYTRLIAPSTKLCKITGIRDVAGKPRDDGSAVRDVTYVTLSLQEKAKTLDGEDLEPGFPKDIAFGYYAVTGGDEKAETTNRITNERIRELVVHALGLSPSEKAPSAALEKAGGKEALIGKTIGVEFTARNGNQNVQSFMPASLFHTNGQ